MPAPQRPAPRQERQERGWIEVLPPDRLVDVPARVHKSQMGGPEEFAQVEPEGMAGHEDAFNEGEVELPALGAEELAFNVSGEEAG